MARGKIDGRQTGRGPRNIGAMWGDTDRDRPPHNQVRKPVRVIIGQADILQRLRGVGEIQPETDRIITDTGFDPERPGECVPGHDTVGASPLKEDFQQTIDREAGKGLLQGHPGLAAGIIGNLHRHRRHLGSGLNGQGLGGHQRGRQAGQQRGAKRGHAGAPAIW